MRVLITGASGFVGSNVVAACPPEWDVVAVYRSRVPDLYDARWEQCELANPGKAGRLFQSVGRRFDLALLFAAHVDVAGTATNPLVDFSTSIPCLINTLDHLVCDRVVYVSSGAVYHNRPGWVNPDMELFPTLPYAIAKLTGEHLMRHYQHAGTVGEYVNVRFWGAYGPGEPDHKIHTRLVRAFGNGDTEFTLRGDGRNLIDAMHIIDAARGFVHIAQQDSLYTLARRTVDFAGRRPVPLKTLTRNVASFFGVTDPTIRYAGDSPERLLCGARDLRVTHMPTMSLNAGIQTYVDSGRYVGCQQ